LSYTFGKVFDLDIRIGHNRMARIGHYTRQPSRSSGLWMNEAGQTRQR
jgi:hypothetical protein